MGTDSSVQYKLHGDQVKLSLTPLRWGNVEVGYGTKNKPLDPETANARYRPFIEEVQGLLPDLKERVRDNRHRFIT